VKKRHLISLFLAFCLFVLISNVVFGAEYVIKLSHSLSTTEPAHKAMLYFAENVYERTNGEVEIEVYSGDSLGPAPEIYEQLRMGSSLIMHSDFGYLSDYVPDLGVLVGPFLVDNPDNFDKILNSYY